MSQDNLLGRLAVHYKLLTRDQLVEALQEQARSAGRRRLGDILIERGWLIASRFRQLLEIQRRYQEKLAQKENAAGEPTAARGTVDDAGPLREAAPPASLEALGSPAPAPSTDHTPATPDARPEGRTATLLRAAVEAGASDLHLHAGSPLRQRRLGDFEVVDETPLTAADTEELLGEILGARQREQLHRKGQVDFSFALPGLARFRVNAYRQQRGTDAVLRIIPPEPPSLTDLGLPLDLARFANYHQGIVLITGPAGCGKSSSLAALVGIINEERRDHVIAVEDPIEYVHRSRRSVVNQRQVSRDTVSFSRALKAALREDPDVIALGELRDLETISLALTAAETGHLVIATLHTTNAIATINRLIGVFPPDQQNQIRTMVSESLRAVISQRLVKKADGSGRVPALEVLVCNKAVGNLIREAKAFQIHSVMQTGASQGMRTLDGALEELVAAGTITRDEAARHAEEPKRFSPSGDRV